MGVTVAIGAKRDQIFICVDPYDPENDEELLSSSGA